MSQIVFYLAVICTAFVLLLAWDVANAVHDSFKRANRVIEESRKIIDE
jgi:hypothetical protein